MPIAFNVWAALIGTNNKGQSLTLSDDDKLTDVLPAADTTLTSTNGASVDFDTGSTIIFEAPDPWNTVKSLKIDGEIDALEGKDLHINGFVHTDIALSGQNDVTLKVDGVKRGKIITGEGDDVVHVGVTTNGGQDWRQTFEIDTGIGADEVVIKSAVDKGLWNNKTDGSTQIVTANLCMDNDSFDSTAVDTKDRVFAGEGNDTVESGSNNDRLHGQDGNDILNAGSGNDVVRGGAGDDTITGGEGYDELSGEGGNDTFIFETGFDYDVIYGFTSGSDILDISATGVTEAQLDSNNDNTIDASDNLVTVQGTALNLNINGDIIQLKATASIDVADVVFV